MAQDIKGDHIEKRIWANIDLFIDEQREVERAARHKQGFIWNTMDEGRMQALKKSFEEMRIEASLTQKPQFNKRYSHMYTHPVTKTPWKLQFYVWPNGNVEMLHREVSAGKFKRAKE